MTKQDIIVVALCAVGIFAWMKFYPAVAPVPPAPPANGVQADPDPVAGDPNSATWDTGAVAPAIVRAPELLGDLSPAAAAYVGLAKVDVTSLVNAEQFEIVVNPNIGGIERILLVEFPGEDGDPELWVGSEKFPMFQVQAQDDWQFSNPLIESTSDSSIIFSRMIFGTGLILRQSYSVDPDKPYGIAVDLELENTLDRTITVDRLLFNVGTMQPLNTSKGFMGAGGVDQRIDIKRAEKDSLKTMAVQKIAGLKPKVKREIADWDINWLAVQNKYFATIVAPEGGFQGCDLRSTDIPDDEAERAIVHGYGFLPEIKIAPKTSETVALDCFVGPKRYHMLKEMGEGKESIMQFDLFLFFHFGWMEWISLLIFNGMLKLKGILGSYGLAIILLTIIIRTLFWPITHRSTVWSKKLQKIQPEAKELREKYKSDPKKMQEKTFELYRTHKINPLSGCLPMFLQIPVFFALFNVLRSAIELRQASFLWAADLSKPDTIDLGFPLNPLAILMGIAMLMQQKVMPTSVDPAQQKMMMFMSLFFVILLYTMPSGLTLYWTVNQLVSMGQYWITYKIIKEDKAPAEAAKA